MLPEQRAHSHRKQLETGFRQDKVKVIWHRVLPVKCSDLPCLQLLTSFIPCLILFFPALVLYCHPWSLPLYWSVLIRAHKSCIILKCSSSIPELCLSIPSCVPFTQWCAELTWPSRVSCVLGHTTGLCDRTGTSSFPFESLRGGDSGRLVWLISPPCHCVPCHCLVLMFILRSCWRAGPAASWDGRGRHPARGV